MTSTSPDTSPDISPDDVAMQLNLVITGDTPQIETVIFGGKEHITILLQLGDSGEIKLTTDAPVNPTDPADITMLSEVLENIGVVIGGNAESIAEQSVAETETVDE